MRILHTSDWHLGKKLFKLDRSPEHEHFLNWLLSTLIEEQIDILLIAGDVFDSPSPPHQSLELFYNFLYRVSAETQTHTYIIAGNHDSALLLEAPSKILSLHRVKVWGKLSKNPEDHWIKIEHRNQQIELCAIPFFRSHELLRDGNDDAISALKNYVFKNKSVPQILMLHHLAGIYDEAGSEHFISLSGVDSIPTELLTQFDYVALGHIHKPQKIGPMTHYSGSPIALRFSETIKKSVVIIELKEDKAAIRLLPIPISRSFHVLQVDEDNWKDKINGLVVESPLTPMVEVQISLKAPRTGLIDEIKNALEKKSVELLSYIPRYLGDESSETKKSKIFELGTIELFEEFYATKYPMAPKVPEELKNDFMNLVEQVKHAPHKT
jgi:exonuclease SbcD